MKLLLTLANAAGSLTAANRWWLSQDGAE